MKRIDVFLRTTSQAYHAYPNNRGMDKVSKTLTKRVYGEDGSGEKVPYFPGNGLRGRFRRHAAKLIMNHLIETGTENIPHSLYLGLMGGMATNSPDGGAQSVAEIIRAQKNAYMGLFGGGARMLESGYKVSDINPVMENTINAGIVVGGVLEPPVVVVCEENGKAKSRFARNARDVTETVTKIHRNDVAWTKSDPADTVRMVGEAGITEHLELIEKERKEKGEDGAGKHYDVSNIMTYLVICSGVPFHFSITLADHMGDAQTGLMLDCLDEFVRDGGGLGGMGSAGWGSFSVCHATLTDFDTNNVYPLYDASGRSADKESTEIRSVYRDALVSSVSSMTFDEVRDYFENRVQKEQKKDKKAKGASEKAPENHDAA